MRERTIDESAYVLAVARGYLAHPAGGVSGLSLFEALESVGVTVDELRSAGLTVDDAVFVAVDSALDAFCASPGEEVRDDTT